MMRIILAAVVGLSLLTACSVNRKVAQPQLDMPEQLAGSVGQDSLCLGDLSWLGLFEDSLLVSLVERTLLYNKDMLVAYDRIRELERRHRVAAGGQFPTVGMEAYVDRETTQGPESPLVVDPEVSALITLSWEIDFFGRLRWAKREAAAAYLQTVEARRALQMSLVAEVASSYFELIALDKELRIVQSTLATRRENIHQARLRFEGGLTSEIPYQQAQVELAKTASMVPDLQLKIKMKENDISFLTGSYPGSVERAADYPVLLVEDVMRVGLPSELIQRRPDVREAELAFKAAVAHAGIQWAERFPRFVIGLDAGLEHTAFKGFFSSPLTYMVAQLASPVFAFGRKKAQYEASLAACQAKCHAYEERVLLAFHEVSNAVEAYGSAVENTRLMEDLKASSRKYVELALFQHLNGHINYLDVLDAQRSYFNAEIQHSNAIRDRYLAMIDLYKALGGGWK